MVPMLRHLVIAITLVAGALGDAAADAPAPAPKGVWAKGDQPRWRAGAAAGLAGMIYFGGDDFESGGLRLTAHGGRDLLPWFTVLARLTYDVTHVDHDIGVLRDQHVEFWRQTGSAGIAGRLSAGGYVWFELGIGGVFDSIEGDTIFGRRWDTALGLELWPHDRYGAHVEVRVGKQAYGRTDAIDFGLSAGVSWH